MNAALAVELVERTLVVCLLVSGPLLLVALVVGVLVSIVQAVTQIQEQTLTFIPKLVAVGAVLLGLLPWMLRQVVEFLILALSSLPSLAG